MPDPTTSEGVPHDRLTRICGAMTEVMEAHPEYRAGDDKCIVFMDSEVERAGGLVLFGYDDHSEAMSAIFTHLTAVFKANGMDLHLVPIEVNQG